MLGWTKWAIALAVAGLAMGEASPVFAEGSTTVAVQRLGPPEIEARREALLKRMLSNPSDLDVAFEYANLSAQVGDYEGAISALERMLIYAPAPISSRPLPIRAYRRTSPPRSASIFSSSRLPPIRRPSLPPSSRRSAGRATPIRDPACRT